MDRRTRRLLGFGCPILHMVEQVWSEGYRGNDARADENDRTNRNPPSAAGRPEAQRWRPLDRPPVCSDERFDVRWRRPARPRRWLLSPLAWSG